MNLNLNIDYNDLVAIIKQLPVSDLKMLNNTINQEIVIKKQVEKSDLQTLLLKAPTWTEEEFHEYQKVREHINKSRLG
jgi:hypothetical protein